MPLSESFYISAEQKRYLVRDFLPMMTARAGSKEFVAVVGDQKTFVPGNFLLEVLDLGTFKFYDAAAVNADEVVMMGPFDHPLVIFLILTEIMLLDHLFLNEKMEGPINGGLGNAPVFPTKPLPQFICRKMLTGSGGEDFSDDRFPRSCELKLAQNVSVHFYPAGTQYFWGCFLNALTQERQQKKTRSPL